MTEIKLLLLGAVLVAFLIASMGVLAVPGGGTVDYSTSKGSYPVSSVGTINVTSGNIYLANVSAKQSTYHWAGIYGNATGTLILGDSSSHKMYEWTAKAKYVFFDDDTSITWGSLDNATCSEIEGTYTFLSGASDSCDNTFTTVKTFDSDATSDAVTNANAAQTYDSSQTAYWYTIALEDSSGTGDIVFVGEVDNNYHASYNGELSNYQVILPENGENGDTGTTTYYIWIELF